MINIIVAYDLDRKIGNQGKIPWKLPADQAFFKEQTLGHPIIMGRKTWESLPVKPLKGRINIVISSNITKTITCKSPEEAIEKAKTFDEEIYIIGGAKIYEYTLENDLIDRIYASEIKEKYEGDTFFPSLKKKWKKTLLKTFTDFEISIFEREKE